MKISKLFHWLYAFLMFLPITFILPTLIYFGFNDNATAQEYTKEEPIYYQSNEVTSLGDIHVDYIYHFSSENLVSTSDSQLLFFGEFYNFFSSEDTFYTSVSSNLNVPRFSVVGTSYFFFASLNDEGTSAIGQQYPNTTLIEFDFLCTVIPNPYFVPCISETDFKVVKEYEEVTYTMGITESVNQALIDTFDLPMFAWATNNVLVAPFSSICSFFGIASTSVLIKYLYYWLTISVIWLVFDVLMYIPLLVHNYIDKARIE